MRQKSRPAKEPANFRLAFCLMHKAKLELAEILKDSVSSGNTIFQVMDNLEGSRKFFQGLNQTYPCCPCAPDHRRVPLHGGRRP
jgi:hypothetical protein